ncbi:MAG: protein-tyrosine kinase [Eubacteriales bacterium]|nr:protein-tyrosine kinase [Eubacteriales bacterium]MDN5364402.1 protein-tyrosine kinase [Eubacteriales bacterium]
MKHEKLITHTNPKSPVAEAYRTLRTNIQFSSLDRPLKTIVVTSAGPGEGKSTIVANFAITLAQAGQRVILVDCDLRKPRLHKLFGISRNGLTNVLVGNLPIEEVLWPTAVPGLLLIPSGPLPPNPAELLGSQKMQNFIEQVSKMGDIVLFDTPPVIAVTDAALLASRVDGVLLVLRAGEVDRRMALQAKEALENARARIIGVVLNDVENSGGSGYYYYYGEGGKRRRKGKVNILARD